MIEKSTQWGRPEDPFTKIVRKYRIVDGVLCCEEQYYAKGYVKQIQCTVSFGRPSWCRRAYRWIETQMRRVLPLRR